MGANQTAEVGVLMLWLLTWGTPLACEGSRESPSRSGGLGKVALRMVRVTIRNADFGKKKKGDLLPARQKILKGLEWI